MSAASWNVVVRVSGLDNETGPGCRHLCTATTSPSTRDYRERWRSRPDVRAPLSMPPSPDHTT
jgi:hypothetical protein